jgi:cyclopropane fatty-acyl-phospholipid synthase-like methyltransferase
MRGADGLVRVREANGAESVFDRVIFGVHSDTALEILGDDASAAERAALGGFRYAYSNAYLHTDVSLMPRRAAVWSSWNYMGKNAAKDASTAPSAGGADAEPCCVSYWLNKLQNLPKDMPNLFVTLNPAPAQRPVADKIIATFAYSHPQYSLDSLRAQAALNALQGERATWFAGAYLGYGFHEDGLTSGIRAGVAAGGVRPAWWQEPALAAPTVLLTPAERAALASPAPLPAKEGSGTPLVLAPSTREVLLCKASGGPYWRDNLGNGGVVGTATRAVIELTARVRKVQDEALRLHEPSTAAVAAGFASRIPCVKLDPPSARAPAELARLVGTTARGDISGFLSQTPDDVLHLYALLLDSEAGATSSGAALSAAAGGVDVTSALTALPSLALSAHGAAAAQGRRAYKSVAVADALAAAYAAARSGGPPPDRPRSSAVSFGASSILRVAVGVLMDFQRGGYTGQAPPLAYAHHAKSSLQWTLSSLYSLTMRAAASPVLSFLRSSIIDGCILLRMPDGEEHFFGNPSAEAPLRARIAIHSWKFFMRVAGESDLGLARSFIAGDWTADDLTALFNIFIANRDRASLSSHGLWTAWIGMTINFLNYAVRMDNSISNSRSNIEDHYDLSNDLFTAFLDPGTMMYSCGFFKTERRILEDVDLTTKGSVAGVNSRATLEQAKFATLSSVPIPTASTAEGARVLNEAKLAQGKTPSAPEPPLQVPSSPSQRRVQVVYGGSLQEAQERKLDHLIARACVQKTDRVLDLGFGWGGLSIRLAETIGCRVHGITLSQRQHDLALERVRARGLQHLISFEIIDYRVFAEKHPGEFDRIISVEMIEAVGHNYFPSYMAALDRLLAVDGIIVIQAIMMPEQRYPEYLKTCAFVSRRSPPYNVVDALTLAFPPPRRRLHQHDHLSGGMLPVSRRAH